MLGSVGPMWACERSVVSGADEPRICMNTPNHLPLVDRRRLVLGKRCPLMIAPSILITLTILPALGFLRQGYPPRD